MIELVPVKPWHIEVLRANGDIDPKTYGPKYAKYICRGVGYTLIVDGKIRGCGGVMPLWPGVGDGWSLLSPWCREHPITLCKAFKGKIASLCKPYKRVQITVEEDFGQAVNFAKYLGFTYEGRMLYYSPDEKTHLRFARYFNG